MTLVRRPNVQGCRCGLDHRARNNPYLIAGWAVISTVPSVLPPSTTMYSSSATPCESTERIVSSRYAAELKQGVIRLIFTRTVA